MFERYTDRARRIIFFARYDASALASSSIDTEHLLLGLLREGAGIAGKIFKRNKLTYELVRREIEARGRLQTPTSTSVDMPLSPEAKLVLQHASEEAERMDASHIDTEHLLLGLLRESECLAADILTSKGEEAIRVEVALPEQKWVVTFFPDGRVAVEVFSASGAVEGESALACLLDRLGPPKTV